MNYWLVKSEPEAYSWAQFVKDGSTAAVAGFMSTTPITSGTTLATITFSTVKQTADPVNIELSGKLYDPEGNEIEAVFSEKSINITRNAALDLVFYLRIAGGVLVFLILCAFIAIPLFRRRNKRNGKNREKLSLRFE